MSLWFENGWFYWFCQHPSWFRSKCQVFAKSMKHMETKSQVLFGHGLIQPCDRFMNSLCVWWWPFQLERMNPKDFYLFQLVSGKFCQGAWKDSGVLVWFGLAWLGLGSRFCHAELWFGHFLQPLNRSYSDCRMTKQWTMISRRWIQNWTIMNTRETDAYAFLVVLWCIVFMEI